MCTIQNLNRTHTSFATPNKRVLGVILITLLLCSNSGYAHTTEPKIDHQDTQLIPGETLALKILINHLMNLLDPASQAVHNTTSTLESDALHLISTYQSSQINPSLSSQDITDGLEHCEEAQIILNDPGSEIELSTTTAMNLEATIANIQGDLQYAN